MSIPKTYYFYGDIIFRYLVYKFKVYNLCEKMVFGSRNMQVFLEEILILYKGVFLMVRNVEYILTSKIILSN